MPQVFTQNGYTNGMFGKWHQGDNYPFRPEDRGFHEVVRHGGGGITQGPDYWLNDYFDDTYWHNSKLEKYNLFTATDDPTYQKNSIQNHERDLEHWKNYEKIMDVQYHGRIYARTGKLD